MSQSSLLSKVGKSTSVSVSTDRTPPARTVTGATKMFSPMRHSNGSQKPPLTPVFTLKSSFHSSSPQSYPEPPCFSSVTTPTTPKPAQNLPLKGSFVTPARIKMVSSNIRTPDQLADFLSTKLALASKTPSTPKDNSRALHTFGDDDFLNPRVINSKPADMNSPAFEMFQKKLYPEDIPDNSPPYRRAQTEDVSNLMASLRLETTPRRRNDSPALLQRNKTPFRTGFTTSRKTNLLGTPGAAIKKKAFDRYIPSNTAKQTLDDITITSTISSLSMGSTNDTSYQLEVAKACGITLDKRILSFQGQKPDTTVTADVRSKVSRPIRDVSTAAAKRKIPTVPERILDAPGITEESDSSVLEWSSNNVLAVGLGPSVYLWNATSGDVHELCSIDDENGVASVSWSRDGDHVAVGDHKGKTQLWNVSAEKRVRTIRDASRSRIGSSCWNDLTLTVGSSSGTIGNHDVRKPQSQISHIQAHAESVSSLKWNNEGSQLASSGKDSFVKIWAPRSNSVLYSKREHTDRVNSLAWCPWQSNLLASGGGANDKQICFWNTALGAKTGSVDTGSEVTAIIWSKTYKELISAQGSDANELIVWKYPTLKKVIELPNAHSARIMHMAISPDGQMVCTGSQDENLKFWKMFATDGNNSKMKAAGAIKEGLGGKKYKSPDLGGLTVR